MTVINPSSISGITSITMPSGSNVLTIHTTDGAEKFRIDSSGNVKVGSACTISQDGDVFFTGVTTATTFTGAHSGSGANLTSLPAAQLSGTLPAISATNLTNVPAANITGTLPALSAASLTSIPAANLVGVCTSGLTKTGGFGKLVDYAQTTKTDTFSENVGEGSISAAAISISHTCDSASNKVLLTAQLSTGCEGGGSVFVTLYIDGSVSSFIRDAESGNFTNYQRTTAGGGKDSGDSHQGNVCVEYLHSPGDTSAHTYDFRLSHNNTGSQELYLNHIEHYGNNTYRARSASSITVMELGG